MNPPQNSQQALAELQNNRSQAKNPAQLLAEQNQTLGVDSAQNTVTGLRSAIDNTTKLLKQVAPSVMGRTGSSLVTSAQANRQIANEQAPISQTLTEQGGQYGEAQSNFNQLTDKASQQAQLQYQGQKDQEGYLQNLYDILYGREQEAEKARQAEIQRQEEIRQFNESLAESRRASTAGSGGFDLSNPIATALGGATATPQSVQDKDAQYLGRLMAEKDTNARLQLIASLRKAAKAGNAESARKFELGKQLGYWKF